MEGKLFSNSIVRHGTVSGYRQHQKIGTRPCTACVQAKKAYDKRYRSATNRQKQNRRTARAQVKAYGELAKRHPEEYRALYLKFKKEFEEEEL